MKDADIKQFFDDNRQKVEDGGFSERIFMALDYLPEPKKTGRMSFMRSTRMVSLLFTIVGFVLFVLFGGYTAILDGMSQLGKVISDVTLLTPETLVSIILVVCSLFAIGKFAVEVE